MYRQEDMAIAKGPLDTLIYSVRGLPEEELQYRRRIYAGMVTCMDDGIGQVMDSLEKRGMAGNTLLFFCSDNGGAPDLGALNDPLRGSKTSLYDGGVKVPAFFHWPDHLPSGSDIDHPLHIVDLFPTLVNQAGGVPERSLPLDGKDIWETLTSGKKPPREEILLNAAPYTGAIRAGDWKLVRNGHIFDCVSTEGEEDRYELFNLRVDPGEEHDLSSKHPDILKDLKERLHAYEEQAQQPFQKTTTWPPPKGIPDFRVPAPKNWGHADSR
jgi:arylsulfatase A-like enzyme